MSKMEKFVGSLSVLTILISLRISGVEPLKNTQIIVPSAVSYNDHVTLTCLYDLENNETLYQIKWYQDEDEFFSYTPKEVPPVRSFSLNGMYIDKSKSDAHKVQLSFVRHEQTGRYRCEVSADAPGFDTDVVSAYMTVVEFSDNNPLIQVAKHRYEVGERIRANCSFGPSRPAANLTMFINNLQVKDQYIIEHPPFEDGSKKIWAKISLELDTMASSFRGGKLKLKCIASIFSVYSKVAEIQLEEEKPRSASVLGSKDSSNTNGLNSSSGKTTGLVAPASSSSKLPSNLSKYFILFIIAFLQYASTTRSLQL